MAEFFAECSFNFFIMIVFAFFLDCSISFSRPGKLIVFPDIFEKRFVAIRSKVTVFLLWNKIWIKKYALILMSFHLHPKARRPTLSLGECFCLHLYEHYRIYVRFCPAVRKLLRNFKLSVTVSVICLDLVMFDKVRRPSMLQNISNWQAQVNFWSP